MNTEKPTTRAGRALLVLLGDIEDGLQEPSDDLTPAILSIEDEARKPLLDTNARLRDMAEGLLRWKHLVDHEDCHPGPVEHCPDPEYAADWAALEPIP